MKQKKILILLLLLVIPMVFYRPVISSARTMYSESGAKVVGKYDDGESQNVESHSCTSSKNISV